MRRDSTKEELVATMRRCLESEERERVGLVAAERS
jgi:hypothetical protein